MAWCGKCSNQKEEERRIRRKRRLFSPANCTKM